jgi:hypothetical protein
VKRLALLAFAVLALGSAPADAATKEYSTGNINVRIAGVRDTSLGVPDAGPVSFVRVSFRISLAVTSAFAITVVSPEGTEVPIVVNRGAGADFGGGEKSCGGILTDVDSDTRTNPISAGSAPFTDDPYRSESNLRSLYGETARGRWRLHIENSGAPATLHCLTLDISRAVPQTLSARGGAVRASVTFTERNFFFERIRMKVVRRGRTLLDSPVQRLHCPECNTFRPAAVRVRDLDGGEPEVLLDMYSGGAHCCSVLLVLRYDAAVRTYRSKLLSFGNYGYRLVDLDRDGLPELSAYDER